MLLKHSPESPPVYAKLCLAHLAHPESVTALASAAQSGETSGAIAMVTGSLVSVSMECEPGSVTGCSAVNNDLVVCAAQECCNVWEYSTQGELGRERGPASLSLE